MAKARVRALAGEQRPEAITAALRALRDRPDRHEVLARITVPTRVVVGALDTLTPPDEAKKLASGVPRSTLQVIEGSGHLTPIERPAEFAAALDELLADGYEVDAADDLA